MRSQHDVAVACRRGIAEDRWPAGSEGRLTSHKIDARKTKEIVQLVKDLKPSALIHAAGPYFAIGSGPLEAAIATGTPYIDLCPRAFRYTELKQQFSEKCVAAGIPVFLGASTVGGITGLLTRHAAEQMDHVEKVETVLSVHNFGWGGGLVSDYLRETATPTKLGRLGSKTKLFNFPDGTRRRVAMGDTLEHIPTDGLCAETMHWFGLNSTLANWSMRIGERLAVLGIPVWHFAGPGGWLAGRVGGHRTNGILTHDAYGRMNGENGLLRTTVIRPYGNVRNPAVLAAITAREISDGKEFGTGFIHPASWMSPERVVRELADRGNEVKCNWMPQ